MLKTRVIPLLLLKDQGLVKTVNFKDPKYVGDPINAVRIFNEKEVDELIFLDTTATFEKRRPNFRLISDIASECFMPFGYGGGIRNLDDVKTLFNIGVEKVVINSYAAEDPHFVESAAQQFGNQSIIVSIDFRRHILGKYSVYVYGGKLKTKYDPVEFSKLMEEMGTGEIILTSIDRDGTMKGYDIEMIKKVTRSVGIPLVASGGAGSIADFRDAVNKGGASAVAAGSLFVFQGRHRAVLINYPSAKEIDSINEAKRK
ncbi:MAG: Imidazole glycerol phosphate synthase subunit HisF [Syntrophorhabdus sp. PtaU1.Bin153]|nr:MAG: Imidazole glycerol phosphate synthase subunit HisF [Syntrophorhabdus sp. PtaU1.Bin153]